MDQKGKPDYPGEVLKAFAYYEGFARHALLGSTGGLSKTQAMMLFALTVHGSSSVGQLADRLAVSREQASRAASALEERGYLEKDRSSDNWRMVQLVPTDKARDYVDEAKKRASASIERSLSVLTEEERDELVACSMRASAILGAAIERIEAQ